MFDQSVLDLVLGPNPHLPEEPARPFQGTLALAASTPVVVTASTGPTSLPAVTPLVIPPVPVAPELEALERPNPAPGAVVAPALEILERPNSAPGVGPALETLDTPEPVEERAPAPAPEKTLENPYAFVPWLIAIVVASLALAFF